MTEITVDLTGIQNGETLVWNASLNKLQRGPAAVAPVISDDVAGLGAPFNGKVGIIRIGSYPDILEEEFKYDSVSSKWIGTTEFDTIRTADTWGMDLSNYPLSSIRNVWARFYNPLPYGKEHTFLIDDFDPSNDTVMSVSNTTGSAGGGEFAASGSLELRGLVISYTGKTSQSFTGCSLVSGTPVVLLSDVTPVVQSGKDQGGWGTVITPIDHVSDMYNSGFVLEERANAFLNGSEDLVTLTVSPFYEEADLNEDLGGALFPNPPAGLRQGVELVSPPDDLGASRAQERGFRWRQSLWTELSGSAPTKRFLIPALYGKMNSVNAVDNGEVYAYTLRHRWVSA